MVKMSSKSIISMVIITVLVLPMHVCGQRTDEETISVAVEARKQAEIDAERDTNATLWIAGGCLFSIFTVGYAYFLYPAAPYERRMGKSSDYVAAYSIEYTMKRHDLQVKYSLIGCGISGVLWAISAIVEVYIKE